MRIEDVVRIDSVKESVLVWPSTSAPDAENPAEVTTQPDPKQFPRNEPTTATEQADASVASSAAAPGEHDTVARHQVSRFGRKRKRNPKSHNFDINSVAPSESRRKLLTPQHSLNSQDTSRLHFRDIPIPRTYRMVTRSLFAAQWRSAMDEVLESLRRHEVWIVVDTNAAGKATVITNRRVFGVKKGEHRFVKRFKARLVVHGFNSASE
ncbi:hypothetical protein ON010_g15537 [Phytophthora cinnamomi]|nr:hypothetical protein ON010_g15537 [Phytophthora cinnamomi]